MFVSIRCVQSFLNRSGFMAETYMHRDSFRPSSCICTPRKPRPDICFESVLSIVEFSRRGLGLRSVQVLLAATVLLYASTCVHFGYTQSLYSLLNRTVAEAALTPCSSNVNAFSDALYRLDNMGVTETCAMAGTLATNVRHLGSLFVF